MGLGVVLHRDVLAIVRITVKPIPRLKVEGNTKTLQLEPSPDKTEHQNTHPLPAKSVR